uniref:Uncharacterized protein n=1 Tax=Pseudonaja textilis TaxID=8673 RepID=A0A670Y5B0_PSETE
MCPIGEYTPRGWGEDQGQGGNECCISVLFVYTLSDYVLDGVIGGRGNENGQKSNSTLYKVPTSGFIIEKCLMAQFSPHLLFYLENVFLHFHLLKCSR